VVISIGDVSAPNFGPDLCLQGTWWPFICIIYLTRDRLEKLKKIGGGWLISDSLSVSVLIEYLHLLDQLEDVNIQQAVQDSGLCQLSASSRQCNCRPGAPWRTSLLQFSSLPAQMFEPARLKPKAMAWTVVRSTGLPCDREMPSYKLVWWSPAPPKVKFFRWLLLQDRLQCRANL
jgi:hypothetical protein